MEGFNNRSDRKKFALNVTIDDIIATVHVTITIYRSIATLFTLLQQIYYLTVAIILNPLGNNTTCFNIDSIVTV